MLQYLFSIRNLLSVALEYCTSVLPRENVQHLGLGSEVLNVLFHGRRVHAPPVLRHIPVEERVHHFRGFVSQPISFDDALVTDHPHNEATFGLAWSILHADLTAID